MFKYETVAKGTNEDATVNHYAYIRRNKDGHYWDLNSDSFKEFNNLVNGKISLTERSNQSGLWYMTVDLKSTSSSITVIPRNSTTDVISGEVVQTYISNGKDIEDSNRERILVNTHYGGTDNLRYVDSNGNGIEGGLVYAYRKANYTGKDSDIAIGVTSTNEKGRWLSPVPLVPGFKYTFVFHKPKEYGPSTKTFMVN